MSPLQFDGKTEVLGREKNQFNGNPNFRTKAQHQQQTQHWARRGGRRRAQPAAGPQEGAAGSAPNSQAQKPANPAGPT